MNSKITNVFGKPRAHRPPHDSRGRCCRPHGAALRARQLGRCEALPDLDARLAGGVAVQGARGLQEGARRRRPGQFDVQIHYNGTLFAQGTEIEAMQRGNLEVGMISPQDIADADPGIFDLHHRLSDARSEASRCGLRRRHRQGVRGQGRRRTSGIHIVRSQYLGTRHVILRKPREVKTPADMAGLKLRMPGSETWQFLGNALGANADAAGLRGSLSRHADRHHRRAGESAARRRGRQVLRGLEAGRADRPYGLQHLLRRGQALSGTGSPPSRRRRSRPPRRRPRPSTTRACSKTEADAKGFFEGKGVTVTTPDVEAFRDQVLKMFLGVEFAANWPKGLLERINAGGACRRAGDRLSESLRRCCCSLD